MTDAGPNNYGRAAATHLGRTDPLATLSYSPQSVYNDAVASGRRVFFLIAAAALRPTPGRVSENAWSLA